MDKTNAILNHFKCLSFPYNYFFYKKYAYSIDSPKAHKFVDKGCVLGYILSSFSFMVFGECNGRLGL
jgi:hypothetical protein